MNKYVVIPINKLVHVVLSHAPCYTQWLCGILMNKLDYLSHTILRLYTVVMWDTHDQTGTPFSSYTQAIHSSYVGYSWPNWSTSLLSLYPGYAQWLCGILMTKLAHISHHIPRLCTMVMLDTYDQTGPLPSSADTQAIHIGYVGYSWPSWSTSLLNLYPGYTQ